MDRRTALETTFLREILRIVGPSDGTELYAVAPGTADDVLEARIARLRELPSGIGHDEMMRRLARERDAGPPPHGA